MIDFQNTFLLAASPPPPATFLSVFEALKACVGRSDIIEVLLDCDAYFSFPLLCDICPRNTHALEWSMDLSEVKLGWRETRREKCLIDNWQLSIFFLVLFPSSIAQSPFSCSLFTPGRLLSVVGLWTHKRDLFCHLTNNTLKTTREKKRNELYRYFFRSLLSCESVGCAICTNKYKTHK